MLSFDVIILGGGPGGITAARVLAHGGKSVALVEDAHWGGACLNCGCIPTKMLLGAVAPQALLRAQQRVHVVKGSAEVDYTALQDRISRFIKGSGRTLAENLMEMGVALFEGHGFGIAPGRIRLEGANGNTDLAAEYIILACGTSPASFPDLAPDGDCVLNSTGLLRLAEAPESLIIVGAGAIGIELGDFFAAMGGKVTVIEAAPHIAPLEDADVAKELLRALNKNGIVCQEGVRAKSLGTVGGRARLTLENGKVITAAKALVAVGRAPNTGNLDAEKLGCVLDRCGYVTTNAFLEAAQGIYAVGDINGMALLAHAAGHQAAYAAARILGETDREYAAGPVPSCIYGGTEIMRVGRTAEALLKEGKTVEVSRAPLAMNPIAQAGGGCAGFVKVVWDQGSIAGIAAVGAGVSHLVTVAQLLMKHGYEEQKLRQVMFAHPTLDEIIPLAIRAPKTRFSA
ncbi:MAG: NAD(P)/FAD-dependent oxidoreductase [Desulfovibrio sp.]|jgi:dihydrolipoamide dehydrogenase|nr:NAD(P)/FAD-dependent oxidoreductase [Desulfovibrio sp.]